MVRSIEKIADRFLNRFAPRIVAKADPCSCSGSGCIISQANSCPGNCRRGYWCCNGCQYRLVRCVTVC